MKYLKTSCLYCGGELNSKTTRRTFCSNKCKVYWHRENKNKTIGSIVMITKNGTSGPSDAIIDHNFYPKKETIPVPPELKGMDRTIWIAEWKEKNGVK